MKNRDASSDIVQDVFVYIWEKRDQIDLDRNIKSYLFQTTYHRSINYLKQNKNVPLTDDQYKLSHTIKDEELFEQEAILYSKKEKIYNSLRHLPPKCKEVFVLSRQNGLTYAEIAKSMGISPKTVENHMVKALSIIRTNINHTATNTYNEDN